MNYIIEGIEVRPTISTEIRKPLKAEQPNNSPINV